MEVNDKLERYFKIEEQKQLKKLREDYAKQKLEQEKEELKKLHYMHCPKCGAKMEPVMMEHIEVDKCPSCLGIYFDNKELEDLFKIEFEKRKTFLHKIFGLC